MTTRQNLASTRLSPHTFRTEYSLDYVRNLARSRSPISRSPIRQAGNPFVRDSSPRQLHMCEHCHSIPCPNDRFCKNCNKLWCWSYWFIIFLEWNQRIFKHQIVYKPKSANFIFFYNLSRNKNNQRRSWLIYWRTGMKRKEGRCLRWKKFKICTRRGYNILTVSRNSTLRSTGSLVLSKCMCRPLVKHSSK